VKIIKYYVYILYSPLVERYFVGRTSNLEKSLARHNSGRNKYTKSGIPWNLVFREGFGDLEKARKRERQIKASRDREELIGFIKKSE